MIPAIISRSPVLINVVLELHHSEPASTVIRIEVANHCLQQQPDTAVSEPWTGVLQPTPAAVLTARHEQKPSLVSKEASIASACFCTDASDDKAADSRGRS